MHFPSSHRAGTGHDSDSKASISSNRPLPTVVGLAAVPGAVCHGVWGTAATPAPRFNGADPTTGPLTLPPLPQGSRRRVVDIPPDTAEFLAQGAARMKDAFAQIGHEQALARRG